MKIKNDLRFIILTGITCLYLISCKQDNLYIPANNIVFEQALSSYTIYQGDLADLIPDSTYIPYDLGSSLFSDFALKQRLIKIPTGEKMIKVDDGLPIFPDGTIIAKTFYYFNDERDESQGKRIIETRLLILENGIWNVADYYWNANQTDAYLIESGTNTMVNFIDSTGEAKVISYHVPNNRECVTCHYNVDKVVPIGPRLRNLNLSVNIDGETTPQLDYFQAIGILSDLDAGTISVTPNYHDTDLSAEERTKGYFDINCAHCHFSGGLASDTDIDFSLELLSTAALKSHRADLIRKMESGNMPSLGTTVIDQESLDFIKTYLNSL